ncbi:MAG: metallophosphoesterase [Vicinamibacterales bacterium]
MDGKSPLRVAHLTAIHIGARNLERSKEGFQAALESLESLNPDCLVLGGDVIHDGNDPGLAQYQWAAFSEVLERYRPKKRDGEEVPIYSILGNHDGFGWGPDVPQGEGAHQKKRKALEFLVPFSRGHLSEYNTYYSVERDA